MDIVWILCFILTVIQTVYCSLCPLVNEKMNITRTIDPSITFITWNKNGIPLLTAEYDSSSGQCFAPSTAAGYTIYCASGGVYTLEIHNPVNGDVYETAPETQNHTIFVQDPVNIDVTLTPQLSADKILKEGEILSISCSVGCTKPKPYIQWMYQKQGEQQPMFIRNMTTSPTSCSGGKWSITDNLDVSYNLISLNDVPFKVVCRVKYSDCDINGVSSASTDYFITFKDTSSSSLTTTISPTAITSQTLATSKTPVTSQTATSDLPTNTGSDSVNDTLIIIIVFSSIAGIIVIVIVVCCCCFLIRHYRSDKRKELIDL